MYVAEPTKHFAHTLVLCFDRITATVLCTVVVVLLLTLDTLTIIISNARRTIPRGTRSSNSSICVLFEHSSVGPLFFFSCSRCSLLHLCACLARLSQPIKCRALPRVLKHGNHRRGHVCMPASETVRVIVRCRPMNQREMDLRCQVGGRSDLVRLYARCQCRPS